MLAARHLNPPWHLSARLGKHQDVRTGNTCQAKVWHLWHIYLRLTLMQAGQAERAVANFVP